MTNAVKGTFVCPKCGESICIVFTKKELKAILREMKLSPLAATISSEQHVLRQNRRIELK